MVALYRILHPETTCLLWPVHIGPRVVALDRFHCCVFLIVQHSIFFLIINKFDVAAGQFFKSSILVCISGANIHDLKFGVGGGGGGLGLNASFSMHVTASEKC